MVVSVSSISLSSATTDVRPLMLGKFETDLKKIFAIYKSSHNF